MKYILLTQGMKSIVDEEDFTRVNALKWFYTHGYARNDAGKKRVYMHRFILGLRRGQYCDHRNHDRLDNRRKNLRVCSQSQNCANQYKNTKNTSGFKGVSYHKTLKYWTASLKQNGKIKVKYRKSKEDAALAYNEMAREVFGEFALLNEL